MWKHKVDVRETVGMALCALLSLAAFLILLAHSNRLPAALGLVISLICPAVWLIVLLWSMEGGGGLVQWVKRRVVVLQPLLR
jgi:hypothetical protein